MDKSPMAQSFTSPNNHHYGLSKDSAEGGMSHVSKNGTAASSYTLEEERQVLRKIDRSILPIMCAVYVLQYLDKQSLSYASVFGLIPDLGLTSVQYSWCASIFYIGQLVAAYPFVYLMSRLHLTKFVGATTIVWGIICMCLAVPYNFPGFAAVRFMLGFAEGAVSPAFISITGIWYQKKEHATRTAIWISMQGVAQILGCMLMYGIGKNNTLSLAPWRVLFIVCGALTSAAGIAFYLLMPNGPKDAWFLTAREKEVLAIRMAKDREGGDKTSFSLAQLREALLDIKCWCFFWLAVLLTMPSPVLIFASLVINTIGYDRFQTMLYTAPSAGVQIVILWIGVMACWQWPKNRTLIIIGLSIIPLIGNILLLILTVDKGWGLIAASWLASSFIAVLAPLLSLSASNVKGNTKRAVVNAMYYMGHCAACVGAPQLWTEKPRYTKGVITGIVSWILFMALITFYRVMCQRDNVMRDKEQRDHRATPDETTGVLNGNGVVGDVTDKEDRAFRYSY